jgi:spore germination cell wall hydrolase CwlJ-like protein
MLRRIRPDPGAAPEETTVFRLILPTCLALSLALIALSAPPSFADASRTGAIDPDSLSPAVRCLGRTVYFEARGRTETEMTAVAFVVRNRVDHPQFPDTPCAVVHEGGENAPCQFSWWCDGRPDVAHETAEFAKSVRIAERVLSGKATDPTGGANMFVSGRVSPRWTRVAEERGRIGAFRFFYLRDR